MTFGSVTQERKYRKIDSCCTLPYRAAWWSPGRPRSDVEHGGETSQLTYLRELLDRLGRALGFTSRTSDDKAVPAAGLASELPESES
jgi:hypothetical protein